MIRNVKSACFVKAAATAGSLPVLLPMVPASGTYKETDEYNDSGTLRTIEFSCRIHNRVPGINDRLILTVTFCDCSCKTIGTLDIPVRLKVEEDSLIKVSCKYQTAL